MKLSKFLEEDDDCKEPTFEAEDIGCQCTEGGVDSEWEWDPVQCCYVCSGCNDVQ